MELGWVDAGVAQVGGEAELELDLITGDAAEDLGDLADERVEIDDLHLGLLPAAELEDLPRNGHGLEAGAVDFLEVLLRRGHARDLGCDDLTVTVDDGEQIVEIMGDAARQQADRVEFLRLPQRLAQAPVLGDIPIDAEQGAAGSALVEDGREVPGPEKFGSVLPVKPAFTRRESSVRRGTRNQHLGSRAVEHPGVPAGQVRRGVAGQLGEFWIGDKHLYATALPLVARDHRGITQTRQGAGQKTNGRRHLRCAGRRPGLL